MTISRVNALGWTPPQTLTPAQANQLDINHANALDKTGDTVATGATHTFASGSTLSLPSTTTLGGTLTVGTAFTVTDTNLTATGANAAIWISTGATCLVTGSGSLLKTVSGARFELGDNDFPTFSPARSLVRVYDLAGMAGYGSGGLGAWTQTVEGWLAPAAYSKGDQARLVLPLPRAHNGSTITQVDVYFALPTKHKVLPGDTSAKLSTLSPAVEYNNVGATVISRAVATNAAFPSRVPTSLTLSEYAPGSGAAALAAYNNGALKKLTITTSVAVDTTANEYAIVLGDEWTSISGALGHTLFQAVAVTYGNVADQGFA